MIPSPWIDSPIYSTTEVCRLCSPHLPPNGLTYRQAHYLAPWVGHERGGIGTSYRWTPRQVVQAYVVSSLLRHGPRGQQGYDLPAIASLVEPGIRYIIVPTEDPGKAFAQVDALDTLDGMTGGSRVTIYIPERLAGLLEGTHPSLVRFEDSLVSERDGDT